MSFIIVLVSWKEVSGLLHVNIVNSRRKFVFSCRINAKPSLTAKNKGKKRKIAETSNVITEALPSVEGEQVSIMMLDTLLQMQFSAQYLTL